LDAVPTVTTPTISSNDVAGSSVVREGDLLTASATAGQADNAVTYAWYSSADGFTTAIGTGATYTVTEGNEGATLEVKATTTNDNGATTTATSTVTATVLDNSSLAISLSVVGNGTVQEGQTLVATATIGDADDANATVTYQWWTSSDGGNTWTPVTATTAGI